ncbi:MAG: ABC transporter permease [Longimicrobiales bacterium]
MDSLLRHVRLAGRTLLKAPLFTATAAFTLALGIGANTAIFSVVNGVLLKALPYDQPEELLGLWNSAPGLGFEILNQAPATYLTYRADTQTLEDVALWASNGAQITGLAEPEQVETLMVSDGFFPVLRVNAAVGRTFTADDDRFGAPETVMLAHDYWQRAFGGDPNAVGRTITMNGTPREIIGVAPAGFTFLNTDPEIFYPPAFDESEVIMGNFSYQLFARMNPGVEVAQVTAELERLARVAVDRYPGPVTHSMLDQARFSTVNRPLKEDLVGNVRPVLWVLLGTVGMVLLIACAHVATLFLVRAEGRTRDVAVRTAMGADRGEIAGQFLTESVVLGLVSGVAGTVLAFGGLKLLLALGPAQLPRLDQIQLDGTALVFTLFVSMVAGLLFGLVPLLRYGKPNLVPSLKEGGRGGGVGKDGRTAQNALVVVQVALALVLLVGSGLMIRSFQALRSVDPGFQSPEEVLTFRVAIPSATMPDADETVQAFQQMEEALRAIPGVQAVGTASAVPMSGNQSNDPVYREDAPVAEGELPPIRRFIFALPGYFAAMGVPQVAGRDLEWPDLYNRQPVVVVSENYARENWNDPREAIGKRVAALSVRGGEPIWHEIIGVVGDIHHDGLDQEPPATMYWPIVQDDMYGEGTELRRSLTFAVRTSPGVQATLLPRAQQAIWSVSSTVPLAQVRTLESLVSRSMARTSFALVMLAIAAGVSLLLGAIGIYGVISYSVSQRNREIGVRMALGAEQRDVSRLIVGQGGKLAGIGVLVGLLAATGLSRAMQSLLYGVGTVDVPTYGAVALTLASVALFASWLPARRAAAVDPAVTLRDG